MDDYPFLHYNIINGSIPKHCKKLVGFNFNDSKDNFVTLPKLLSIKNTSFKTSKEIVCHLTYNKKLKKVVTKKDLKKMKLYIASIVNK